MSVSLENKVAIITGGSKGIGKATALELAKRGVHTALFARTEKDLIEAIKQIAELPEAKQYNLNPSYQVVDLTSTDSIIAAVTNTKTIYGHIDILINNAGVYELDYIRNISPQKIGNTVDTNLKGNAVISRALLDIFNSQENGGSIVDVLSTAGIDILDQNNSYAATKHGQRVFSNILALEEPKLRIYRIYPSNTETEGRKESKSELEKAIRAKAEFLPASDIGVEITKLVAEEYPIEITDIKVSMSNGKKLVERVILSPLKAEYIKLN